MQLQLEDMTNKYFIETKRNDVSVFTKKVETLEKLVKDKDKQLGNLKETLKKIKEQYMNSAQTNIDNKSDIKFQGEKQK